MADLSPMSTNGTRSRILEDVGFAAAIALGLLYGIAEALARIGLYVGDKAPDTSFPWGLLIVMSIMAAPKTLGRATAGRIWDVIAGRGSRSIGGADGPGDPPR